MHIRLIIAGGLVFLTKTMSHILSYYTKDNILLKYYYIYFNPESKLISRKTSCLKYLCNMYRFGSNQLSYDL